MFDVLDFLCALVSLNSRGIKFWWGVKMGVLGERSEDSPPVDRGHI